MLSNSDRRRFLGSAAAGGVLMGLGDLGFLSRLRPVSAAEARLDPDIVRLRPEIEPLVRLLEETPRDQLLEEVADRMNRGSGYREILAALLLAGVRNVEPRPSVGYKFHTVLVVNSAHLASLASPDADRWLPIFWALDYFKSAQGEDERERGWTMPPVDESTLPPARNARRAFIEAMERWDEPAADAAVASLARTAGLNETYELFFRFGARDFRSIGHKAIFVANSYRTLQCIGSQHAEPILRSLAYALLMHEDGNPAERDADADRPWRQNQERAERIRDDWKGGLLDPSATAELLQVLREGSEEDAPEKVVELLNRGVSPQSLWDALFDGAGELIGRQPAIVALHAGTTTNALHFAFQASHDDRTRRLVLLQNAAFLPMFREGMKDRGRVGDLRIDQIEPETSSGNDPTAMIEEIFAEAGRDRATAARKALAYLQAGHSPNALIDAARRLVFLKGNDAHDYKYSSAALEDYFHTSPQWRDRYLASSLFLLPSSQARDNQLVERTRAALQS